MWAKVHAALAELPAPVEAALQPQDRWRGGRWRQRSWKRWGGCHSHHLPNSWPRWLQRAGHQCQVGKSQPERSSNQLWEARLPRRNSWRLGKWRSPKVLARNSGSPWGLPVPKEYQPPNLQAAFLMFSLQNSPRSGKIWHALLGVHSPDSAGSCRGLSGQAPGRCQLVCNSCKMPHHYAKGYTISLVYPWGTPPLLSLSSSPMSVSVFLLVVGCVGLCQYQGREGNLG